VLAAFFINGALIATWVSRIPAIQTRLGLSEGGLGFVLLGIAAGTLVALSLAGGQIARYGSPNMTLFGALVMCVTLPLIPLAPSAVLLWIVLFVFGGAMSIMDVAMNEQAVLVERNAGRPLMSSFHASFSIGGFAGALLGAGMASIPFTPLVHFAIVGLAFGTFVFFIIAHMMPTEREAKGSGGAVFRLPERALWMLGAVAFCSAIGEGAMADWSAVFLNQVLGTTAAFAALGFAAFSLTMTVGRLIGDSLSARFLPSWIVRAGGLAASLGILAAVLTDEPVFALAGFAAVGMGLANIVPLAFSASGNRPDISPSVGIAGVATIGYAGFLAGPPVIGLIAEATSLRVALFLVAILIASVIFTARTMNPAIGA
jgi:predicted MFS family arabinose efflux permease